MLAVDTCFLFLNLFSDSIDSRISKEPQHFAHHAELYKTSPDSKPYATTYQCEDEHVAPHRIIDGCYQLIYIHKRIYSGRCQWKEV